MMHLESLANGLGGPSLWLLIMAIRKEIPATVAITADTGWENDRLWNTGRRSTNQQYFDEVIVPLCKGSHVTPRFVRSVDKHKRPLPPLRDILLTGIAKGRPDHVPLFGSRGGRQRQSCTDKMKIRAIRQEQRRLGAKTGCCAQGIHYHEADRRVKGTYLRQDGKWSIYQTTVITTERIMLETALGVWTCIDKQKVEKPIKWQTHYYPLVDLRMSRADVYAAIQKEGIPYIVSSECDLCPHKDLPRWDRSSQETIDDGERIETAMGGKFFFTDRRIPLKLALADWRADRAAHPEKYAKADTADFGCKNDSCGT